MFREELYFTFAALLSSHLVEFHSFLMRGTFSDGLLLLLLLLYSLLLDNERWKQAEVPAEFQNLVNSIADGKISLPDRKVSGQLKQQLFFFFCLP